jgi:orotidine-5'-phosphate decarboxylase
MVTAAGSPPQDDLASNDLASFDYSPSGSDRLIVALDTADPARAAALAAAVAPYCGLVKLGLEFFIANGAAGVRAIDARPVFLDLKLHDIPNTVAGAVRAALPMAPRMLTLHAAGGAAMIEAARRASERAGADRPLLLAVTVLTSLDAAALTATGIAGGPTQQALRLARLALDAGADGLVCSPLEVAPLRAALGDGPSLVVPGIRPPGDAPGDQARVMTPAEAVRAGADWIVVGRPITDAADPAAAAQAIAAAIDS